MSGTETSRRAAVNYILMGLENGAFKPVIDQTVQFDDMVEAHRYLEGSSPILARSSSPF
nr:MULTISPECIES: zinc-binding dehydrogenase [Bradyrhizobium]